MALPRQAEIALAAERRSRAEPGVRRDVELGIAAAAIAAHEAAADPHPQYATDAEVAAAIAAASTGGVLPMVTGEVPPVLVYTEDGSLVYFEV